MTHKQRMLYVGIMIAGVTLIVFGSDDHGPTVLNMVGVLSISIGIGLSAWWSRND